MQSQLLNSRWRGLGAWNFYFLVKFALLTYGYLNFHPYPNLIFLAFLLLPIASDRLHKIRQWISIPIGAALFYHDTWLPSIYSISSQGANLLSFSIDYNLELLRRFINWNLVGGIFVCWVSYLFLQQWLRFTSITIIGIAWLNISQLTPPDLRIFFPEWQKTKMVLSNKQPTKELLAAQTAALSNLPLNQQINNYINTFYRTESQRVTTFQKSDSATMEPFHILFVHICSMAWKDLDAIKQNDVPFWQQFDILLTNFNSAASYSNPSALRFLRGACGQPKFDSLFKPALQECLLIPSLKALNFEPQLMLDHDGKFANFLQDIKNLGGLSSTALMSQEGLPAELEAFYSGPIFDDQAVLTRWMENIKKAPSGKTVTFFNIIPLHDGNRTVSTGQPAAYSPVVTTLYGNINNLFHQLEQQRQKAIVVVIGAHGRNYTGDSIQMAGLRDIPTPDITHTPVGIKFIGLNHPASSGLIEVKEPTSYLAISELLSRSITNNIFGQSEVDWGALVKKLPKTLKISANESATVVDYRGQYYVQLKGDASWVAVPQ